MQFLHRACVFRHNYTGIITFSPQKISADFFYGNYFGSHQKQSALVLSPKTTLMLTHTLLSRCIILAFMIMVGYSIAKSVQAASTLGLTLAITSLFLGVYFIYLLGQAKRNSN